MSDHESLERLRRNRSNLGFQSATGRTRRGEPDRSCRLPSPPAGRTRPVASLLVRDQAGCPFDETGRMPMLRPARLPGKFTQPGRTFIRIEKVWSQTM